MRPKRKGPPKKNGRPPWLPTKKILDKIAELASYGFFDWQIADCLDINRSFFSELKSRFPEINEVLERGQSKGGERVVRSLLRQCDEGNVTAIKHYTRVKLGWRENDDKPTGSSDPASAKENPATVSERILAALQPPGAIEGRSSSAVDDDREVSS